MSLRLRTIEKTAAWFKELDPESCINPYFLRTLVLQGKIPFVNAGKKYLLTIESVEKFMSGGIDHEQHNS